MRRSRIGEDWPRSRTGDPGGDLCGRDHASRVAGSQLRAIGLAELVTEDLAACEVLALALAHEPALLARDSARLRASRTTHSLFDMTRLARALDDVLAAAWENLALQTLS